MNLLQFYRYGSLCVALLILIGVSGCASSGNQFLKNETEETISKKVFEGKTTKAEVRAMFGSPQSTTFTDGGREIWTYVLVEQTADAVNFIPIVNSFGSSYSGTTKQLVIMYDLNSVVKRCSMSEADSATKTGLLK